MVYRFTAVLLLAALPSGEASGHSVAEDPKAFRVIQPLLGTDHDADSLRARFVELNEDRYGDLLLQVIAKQHRPVNELLAAPLPNEPPDWLVAEGGDQDPLAASVLLAIAERLHHEGRHADCLAWLRDVGDQESFSPALLAYLRAVASRQSVDYQGMRTALEQLDPVANDALSPSRQAVLDEMRRELGDEDPEGLPHIAKLMQDAERRLAIARPDLPTQTQQQRALDGLDYLIEQLEEQQRQQQSAQSAGGAGMGSPADESRPSDLKGSGDVDRKRFAAGEGWGNLPPAEREKLAQDLTQGFPERYRALISEYFEAIAEEPNDSSEETRGPEGSP